ncbi:MAG: hypothetical protein HY926_07540, partial [Elusimicrobia bacterium]|nr:hypothetical protein [Elusimicrobiota bacterium]
MDCSGQRRQRRLRWAGLKTALLAGLCLISGPGRAGQQTLSSGIGAGTDFAGQRNVIYVPGVGVWVFYHSTANGSKGVWRFSGDGGSSWTAETEVFPYTLLAPGSATPMPGVWWRADSDEIYAAATDGNIDIQGGGSFPGTNGAMRMNDTSGNYLYVRHGWLCNGIVNDLPTPGQKGCPSGYAKGAIYWDPGVGIRSQQTTAVMRRACQATLNTNQTGRWDILAQHSAVVVFSSDTLNNTNGFVTAMADASGYVANYEGSIGVIGVPAFKNDLSDYYNRQASTAAIYAFCYSATGAAGQTQDPTMNLAAAPVLVPTQNSGTYQNAKVLMGMRIPNNNNGAMNGDIISGGLINNTTTYNVGTNVVGINQGVLVVRLSSGSAVNRADRQDLWSTGENTIGDDAYGMTGLNIPGTSTGAFVWVNATGSLHYDYRSYNTVLSTDAWSQRNPVNAPVIEGRFAAVGPNLTTDNEDPLGHPTLSFVSRADSTNPGWDAYVAYASSEGLHYLVIPSTYTGGAVAHTFYWRRGNSAGELNGDNPGSVMNPKVAFWGRQPNPLPIIWHDQNSAGRDVVMFDKIITSTFPIPTISAVTTQTISGFPAYLTTPTYDLLIKGTSFYGVTIPNNPTNAASTTSLSFQILSSTYQAASNTFQDTAQNDIAVNYVNWVTTGDAVVNVTLSNHMAVGTPLPLRLLLPDGQEYPSYYDRVGCPHNSATFGPLSNCSGNDQWGAPHPNIDQTLTLTLYRPAITNVYKTKETGVPSAGLITQSNGTSALVSSVTVEGSNFMNWTGLGSQGVPPSANTVRIQFQNVNTLQLEPGIVVTSLTYTGGGAKVDFNVVATTAVIANQGFSNAGGPYHILLTNPSSGTFNTVDLNASGTFYITIPTVTITESFTNGYWFSHSTVAVVTGTASFNDFGQTMISSVQVQIAYQGGGAQNGYIWDNILGRMVPPYANQELNWSTATLSQAATAFWFIPADFPKDNPPPNGAYAIRVRALTKDGAVGNPCGYGAPDGSACGAGGAVFVSTAAVNVTADPPFISSIYGVGVPDAIPSAGVITQDNATSALVDTITVLGSNLINLSGYIDTGVVPGTGTALLRFQNVGTGLMEPGITVTSMAYIGAGGTQINFYLNASTSIAVNQGMANAGGPYHMILTNPPTSYLSSFNTQTLVPGGTFYVTFPTATITSVFPGGYWTDANSFQIITGTVGFNNVGQTSITGVQVKIVYQGSGAHNGFVWNGTQMGPPDPNEGLNWLSATLSPSATAYWYQPVNFNTTYAPDDGPYAILVRALSKDGGVGNPSGYGFPAQFVSTQAVSLDRFPPQFTSGFTPLPLAGSTNTIANVRFSFRDIGTGMSTVQFLIQDIGLPAANTSYWRAFGSVGDLGPADLQLWVGTGMPTMPIGPGIDQIVNLASGPYSPLWQSGHQYRISVGVRSVGGNCLDTSTGTYACGAGNLPGSAVLVIYDTAAPNLTIDQSLAASSGAATYLTAFSSVTGSYLDDVLDARDSQTILLRLVRLDSTKVDGSVDYCLDYAQGQFISCTDASAGSEWVPYTPTLVSTITPNPWTYNLPSVAVNQMLQDSWQAKVYRVDAYVADGAGNSSGTAVAPLYKQFFRLDNVPPMVSLKLSTGSVLDADEGNAALEFSTASTVGLYQVPDLWVFPGPYTSSNPLTSIRLRIADAGSGVSTTTARWALTYRDVNNNKFQWNPPPVGVWQQQASPIWVVAGTTMAFGAGVSAPYEVALASGVDWSRSSEYYTFQSSATDLAGNIYYNYWNFIFDSSAPVIDKSYVNISSGISFGSPFYLPQSVTGQVEDQKSGDEYYNSGVLGVRLGFMRLNQSAVEWFTLGSGWQPVRNDFEVPPTSQLPNAGAVGWSKTLNDRNGPFWNNTSTSTYFLYAYSQDNVAGSSFTNRLSSMNLVSVFQWDVDAPTSTLIAPSTTYFGANMVWYSTYGTYSLPFIIGTAFDQPFSGPGAGSNQACASPVLGHAPAQDGWPGTWPGGALNICHEEVQIFDTNTSYCWDGGSFNPGASCNSNSTYKGMSSPGLGQNYRYDVNASGLMNAFQNNHTYMVTLRGRDASADGGPPNGLGYYNPNVELPPTYAQIGSNCANIAAATYNARCFKIDKNPPTSVITQPGTETVTSVPTITGTAIDGTIANPESGLVTVWVAICKDDGSRQPDTSLCYQADGSLGAGMYFGTATMSGAPPYSGSKEWTYPINNTNLTIGNGPTYDIIVYSTDAVDNVAPWTNPAPPYGTPSNHTVFTVVPGGGSAGVTQPSDLSITANPYFKPDTLGTIGGTAQGSQAKYVQLVVKATDTPASYYDGNGNWVPALTLFPAAPNPVPVNGGAGDGNWTYIMNTAKWNVNHNYQIWVYGCADTSCAATVGPFGPTLNFVVDSSAPVVSVTKPALAYASMHSASLDQVVDLSSATVSDNAPYSAPNENTNNSLSTPTVYFQVIRLAGGNPSKYWDYKQSAFSVDAGAQANCQSAWDDTCLQNPDGWKGGTLFAYTTTYMSSYQMFEDGYSYRVDVKAKDKAGNPTALPNG